ncbi:MAG: hypothetical protein WCK98_00375 [bacterium]
MWLTILILNWKNKTAQSLRLQEFLRDPVFSNVGLTFAQLRKILDLSNWEFPDSKVFAKIGDILPLMRAIFSFKDLANRVLLPDEAVSIIISNTLPGNSRLYVNNFADRDAVSKIMDLIFSVEGNTLNIYYDMDKNELGNVLQIGAADLAIKKRQAKPDTYKNIDIDTIQTDTANDLEKVSEQYNGDINRSMESALIIILPRGQAFKFVKSLVWPPLDTTNDEEVDLEIRKKLDKYSLGVRGWGYLGVIGD